MSGTFEFLDGPKWYVQPWWPGEPLVARQESLLRILTVGHREKLDIVPLIACLADEHRFRYRRILQLLAHRIESGSSLVVALEQTPDALKDEEVLALRLASQSATWPQTFQELLDNRLRDRNTNRSLQSGTWFYWVWLSLIIFMLITFMFAVIVPTFKKMADEFGMGLPNGFIRLIQTFESPTNMGWMLLLVTILVVWFSFFRAPRRFFERKVAPRLLRPVAQRQIIEIYRMLAIALDAGKPLEGALSTLARHHYDAGLRRQLLFARNEVEQGVEIWQSLYKASVMSQSEAQALSESSNSEIRSWTLRQLANKKLSTSNRKTASVVALIEPAVTLFFGGLVLWVCFSLFSFLTSLINALA